MDLIKTRHHAPFVYLIKSDILVHWHILPFQIKVRSTLIFLDRGMCCCVLSMDRNKMKHWGLSLARGLERSAFLLFLRFIYVGN